MRSDLHYWRKAHFETLTRVAAHSHAFPEWNDYTMFCEQLSEGLRKQSFACLERFICKLEKASFAKRKTFVNWILHETYRKEGEHLVKPYPLQNRIIDKTLAEWLERNPDSGEAHRWIGGYEHLQQALAIDPNDQIARRKLIVLILNQVAHSTHELPHGYLGNPENDRRALTEAASLLESVSDEQLRQDLSTDVDELMVIVDAYRNR
jgi:hypothetical protein